MAALISASTPPPPSSIRTPPTPRLGWEDDYQPYTPRVVTRSQQRSRVAKTPPPVVPAEDFTKKSTSSVRVSKERGAKKNFNLTSPAPNSPPTANKKTTPRNSDIMGHRRVSGALTSNSTAVAAQALGIEEMDTGSRRNPRGQGMLPTPSKTPVNRESKRLPSLPNVARTLFPPRVEDAMPQPKKSGRNKYADNFEVQESPIHIFTDSQDRIPEIDYAEDNPFYGASYQPDPTKRVSNRRRVSLVEDGVDSTDDHKDGMYYVFRGKKIFRKFDEIEPERSFGEASDDDVEMGMGGDIPSRLRKPLTRAAVKPRLLFPPKAQPTPTNEDEEEAETEVEEEAPGNVTPKRQTAASTPKAPRFAPFTPPTTARATRSKDVNLSGVTTPKIEETSGGKKISPFDSWQRTKNGPPAGKKRQGEPISRGSVQGKRVRGGQL